MKKRNTIKKVQTPITWAWEDAKKHKCRWHSIPYLLIMKIKSRFPSLNWMPNCDLWIEIKYCILLLTNLILLFIGWILLQTSIIPMETYNTLMNSYIALRIIFYVYVGYTIWLILRLVIIGFAALTEPNMIKYTKSYITLVDKPKKAAKKEKKKAEKLAKRK